MKPSGVNPMFIFAPGLMSKRSRIDFGIVILRLAVIVLV